MSQYEADEEEDEDAANGSASGFVKSELDLPTQKLMELIFK